MINLRFLFAQMTVAAVLSACGSPAPNREPIRWTVDEASTHEVSEAKDAILRVLKDPGSARFGKAWAMQGSNGLRSTCIYVNARNSFGGYTGFKIAHYANGSVQVESSDFVGQLVRSLCTARVVK